MGGSGSGCWQCGVAVDGLTVAWRWQGGSVAVAVAVGVGSVGWQWMG
jgi:hypothetical protein